MLGHKLSRKTGELVDLTRKKKVDVLCFQETRWKGSKGSSLREGLRFFRDGADGKINEVGFILKEEHFVCPLA